LVESFKLLIMVGCIFDKAYYNWLYHLNSSLWMVVSI